ncbi:MAG: PIN domain-containing protein [Patescibacteria group bacterium]
MIDPKRIFIDTSAWVELMLKGEKYHQEVSSYFTNEDRKGSIFFTNDYVLDETWTRLLTWQGLFYAKSLRKKTREAQKVLKLNIIWTDENIFNRSWKNFEKFGEHKLSFTDAVITTVVKDLRIDEILTLDAGFQKVGFTVKPDIRQ